MSTSQNGYAANLPNLTTVWTIPGTERSIRLKRGACGEVLVHFAAWFHDNIEPLDEGQLDDWGYAERPIRGSTTELSNHASGTAMDLNATKHPLGARGTFTREQTRAIHDQLRIYDGCIRWGGDYVNRADEMHFEIDKPLAEVTAVAQKLKTEEDMPLSDNDAAKVVQALLKTKLKVNKADGTGTEERYVSSILVSLFNADHPLKES